MRKRLLALFVLTSAAAGCSLLVDFDREKIPSVAGDVDASGDGSVPTDAGKDGTSTDGTTDAPVSDAPVDAPVDGGEDANDGATDGSTDAPVDAPADAPADAPGDASDAGTDAPTDAGTDATTDAGTDAADDAADAADTSTSDASLSTYCSTADFDAHDLSAQANVDVTFPSDGIPAQYSPNCVKIKVGATVTFTGDFGSHPLTAGGSTGTSPIPASTSVADDGGAVGSLVVTFGTAGTYDFHCGIHGSQMFGGVLVVP